MASAAALRKRYRLRALISNPSLQRKLEPILILISMRKGNMGPGVRRGDEAEIT